MSVEESILRHQLAQVAAGSTALYQRHSVVVEDRGSRVKQQHSMHSLAPKPQAQAEIWGLPKIRGTILGVPIIRTIVFWGLYWGPLI